MKPIPFKQQTCIVGKSQPQYNPLPIERRGSKEGEMISCWQPTFWERIKILFGYNIYSSLITFHEKIQPQNITIGYPETIFTFWDGVDENGKKINVRHIKESKLTEKDKQILKKNNIEFKK